MFVCEDHVAKGLAFFNVPHVVHADTDDNCVFCDKPADFLLYCFPSTKGHIPKQTRTIYLLRAELTPQKMSS
ncbi:hypothetical protein J2S21_004420 [Peribacillus cavernae]|nr:hypothetical protein [Peribacillus cavernae]